MIYDHLTNADLYKHFPTRIITALDFACQTSPDIADGKYPIVGNLIYAAVATYDSKDPETLLFEAHKNYIDLQLILQGHEKIDITDVAPLTIQTPYDQDKDIAFYTPPKTYTSLTMQPGQFALIYPHEAHRPGTYLENTPCPVKKMVIKIHIED